MSSAAVRFCSCVLQSYLQCCVKPKTAVIESTPEGELQLKEIQVSNPEEVIAVPHSTTFCTPMSRDVSGSFRSGAASSSGTPAQQLSPTMSLGSPEAYGTPRSSFVTASPAPAEPLTATAAGSSGMIINVPALKSQLKANFQEHR